MNKLLKITAIAVSMFGCAAVSLADGYQCSGTAPEWSLHLDAAQGRFVFPSATELEVMLVTIAQGQDWPRAYTLIGERDTAIVLLEQETCDDAAPYRAHVLTQRGQTPLLLTGCCQTAP